MAKSQRSSDGRRTFLRATGLGLAGFAANCTRGTDRPPSGPLDRSQERARRGVETLRKVGGENYDAPIHAISEVSPDFARLTVDHAYGEVVSRPTLDLPTREAITVASLVVQGNHLLPIRYHLDGFLNVGGKPESLVELCILSIGINGFPSAIRAIGLIRDVLKKRGMRLDPLPVSEDDGTERYVRGVRNRLAHSESGLDEIAELAETSPAFSRLLTEFVYGELLTRDGLDARTKYLSAISMLATQGNDRQSLRRYALGALRRGVDRAEIIEVMIQLTVYSGYPTAVVGLFDLVGLFDDVDRGAVSLTVPDEQIVDQSAESREVRFERGTETLSTTSAAAGERVIQGFEDIAPDSGRMIVEHAYGDIFSRPGLDRKTRELTAVASMASVGTIASETPVKVHVHAALTAGATRDEVIETLLNLVPYVGYPKVERSLALAKSVFDERGSSQQ